MTDDRRTPGNGADSLLEDRTAALLRATEGMGGGEEHRREALMERAEFRGLDRSTAEQAYDIACEESLEPAYGMAVVLEGISVRLLDGPRPGVEARESSEPEWVDRPPSPDAAERERRLRQTFRRLRAKVEASDTTADAFRSFVGEPDLEPYDF